MGHHAPRRVLLGAGALVLLAAGCGSGDDDAGPDPAPGPSDGSASSATSPSGSSSASPSDAPSPPWDAQEVALRTMSLQLPSRWRGRVERRIDLATFTSNDRWVDEFSMVDSDAVGPPISVDQSAGIVLESTGYLRDPGRRADVVVDGVPMYHLSGPISDVQHADLWGGDHAGRSLRIVLEQASDKPVAQRRALARQVLATVRIDD